MLEIVYDPGCAEKTLGTALETEKDNVNPHGEGKTEDISWTNNQKSTGDDIDSRARIEEARDFSPALRTLISPGKPPGPVAHSPHSSHLFKAYFAACPAAFPKTFPQ